MSAITREELVEQFTETLAELRQVIAAEKKPAKKALLLGRHAETLVRAIATLYPPRQQLELSRGPEHDWSTDRNYLEGLKLEIEHRLSQMPKELPPSTDKR